MSLNVCGVNRRLQYDEFVKFLSSCDVICLTETKTDDTDVVQIPGFSVFLKNRCKLSNVRSGGIALLFRDSLVKYVTVIKTDCAYISWFKMSKSLFNIDEDIYFGVVYIPPEGSKYSSPDCYFEIENELIKVSRECKYMCLMGDFNSRVGKLNDFIEIDDFLTDVLQCSCVVNNDNLSIFDNSDIPRYRTVQDTSTNNFGYKLVDFCVSNNLYIVNSRVGNDKGVGAFTCKSKSTVDYVLSSRELFNMITKFDIRDFCPLLSDVHNPVTFCISTVQHFPNCSNYNHTGENQPSVKLWRTDKADDFRNGIDSQAVNNIETHLNELCTKSNICKEDVNKVATDICHVYMHSARQTFGVTKKVQKSKNKPWFNGECRTARRKFHLAKRLYYRQTNTETRDNLKTTSKSYKRIMDNCIKNYKNGIARKLTELRSTNPKEYWKILNSSNENKKCAVDIDRMFRFMSDMNAGDCDDDFLANSDNSDIASNDEILNSVITEDEIEKAVRKLKHGKAPGYDNVLNEHISSTLSIFLPVYKKFFNIIFNSGFVPDEWLLGVVKPIYKNKGDPTSPENYRPITLLSCLGKLFTCILNNRLETYAEEVSLVNENQAGFRKNYSTLDHILSLQFLSHILMSKKKKLFCAFIDFKQAFDTVWRSGLWNKLIKNGIKGKCFTYIRNMYIGIKSTIKISGMSSDFFTCNVGVRQGENLSPFLFALYINDLEYFLQEKGIVGLQSITDAIEDELMLYLKLLILLYADDTVIMAESADDLQNALNEFFVYCTNWKLVVNVEKTKILIFSKGPMMKKHFYYNGVVIENVKEFKYLGIVFSRSGSFCQS